MADYLYHMRRPLTHQELMAELENLSEDDENEDNTAADVAGTFEIHSHTSHQTSIEEPSATKKRKLMKVAKQDIKCEKTEPTYKNVPDDNEYNYVKKIQEQVESLSPFEIFF
ncbi:hypothetical protein ILUMI_24642 [Ignelater luminosus]|uniref:Uncharacterized protein n=1 Tax=Ignelater luminosus TaxID=2038154 RepID=A0A8K0C8S5_IGNLU|nr:hypothetical protein ILUMI_24642 [Ignelater luminosus]